MYLIGEIMKKLILSLAMVAICFNITAISEKYKRPSLGLGKDLAQTLKDSIVKFKDEPEVCLSLILDVSNDINDIINMLPGSAKELLTKYIVPYTKQLEDSVRTGDIYTFILISKTILPFLKDKLPVFGLSDEILKKINTVLDRAIKASNDCSGITNLEKELKKLDSAINEEFAKLK